MTALRAGRAAERVRGRVVGALVGLDLGEPDRDPRAADVGDHDGAEQPRRQRTAGPRERGAVDRQSGRPGGLSGDAGRASSAGLLGDPDAARCRRRRVAGARCEPATVSTSRTSGVRCGRDRGELVVGQLGQLDAARSQTRTHAPATSCATRNGTPCAHQPLGDVGREREALRAPARPGARCRRRGWRSCPVMAGSSSCSCRRRRRPAPCPPAGRGCRPAAAP